MGYASSTTGTVTGGSEEVNIVKEMTLLGTLYRIYQRGTATTTRITGVSLATAQSLCTGNCNLGYYMLYKGSGTALTHDTCFSCKGTKQSGSYSQIGDSNLYEVTLTSTTLAIRKLNGTWDGTANNLEETGT